MMNQSYELATFSHEINNNLTLIYGQLQYIENTNESLKNDENWHKMKDDFSSLFDLIRQVLSPTDTTSAAVEPQDLIQLFKEIQSSWSYRLNLEHIGFYVHADSPGPYYVYGPKPKLLQMFHNLVSNAVKAIQRKKGAEKAPNITITLNREQGHIVLNLSDTGIGMTKEQQARAFYRGVSFIPQGNGIGLSVVYEIAEELHIRIHMDSAINHGTTFTLVFPSTERVEAMPV